MRKTLALIVALAAVVAVMLTSSPAQAQTWAQPPTSIELSHVEGSMATGWYVEGHRYGLPIFANFPRIGFIRNVTCAEDETGACEAAWLRFYRELALFRDSEPKPASLHATRGPVVR